MNIPRTAGAEPRGSADPLFWGLAALLSIGSTYLPKLIHLEGDQIVRTIIVVGALFASGALVGCVRPQRPWRWAAAALLAFVAQDVIVAVSVTGYEQANWEAVAGMLVSNLGTYLGHASPVLLGAMIGGSMMSAGLD